MMLRQGCWESLGELGLTQAVYSGISIHTLLFPCSSQLPRIDNCPSHLTVDKLRHRETVACTPPPKGCRAKLPSLGSIAVCSMLIHFQGSPILKPQPWNFSLNSPQIPQPQGVN